MWGKLTIFQYQQLVPAIKEPDETERNVRLISIINNWTEAQVDSLSVQDYIIEKEKLKFLSEDFKGNPVKHIKVNGKRYRCVYDLRRLPAARYIEGKVFSQDFVGNLHKIAASMVMPQKKTLFGWKDDKYDAAIHEDYAQDMLEARFIDVYHSIVFFYQVYRNWMEISKAYLIQEAAKKIPMSEAVKVVHDLLKSMDGNIAPNLLPNTKVAELQKRMNLMLWNT